MDVSQLTKEQILNRIENLQVAECALFNAEVLSPMEHAGLCTQLQNLTKRVNEAKLEVFEVK